MIKKILNRKYIKLVTILLILVAILSVIYYIDLNKFNSKLVDYDEEYLLDVTYLIGNRDKLGDEATIYDTTENHDDDIMYTTRQIVPLTKKGEYLYVDLSKFANEVLFDHISDVQFAYNNVNAEILDNCFYDRKTRMVKIPLSVYQNSDSENNAVAQLELESVLTEKEISNIKIDYGVKKLLTYEATTTTDLYELQTDIPLSNYINGRVANENFYIYLNNSSDPIDSSFFTFDNTTKTLALDIPAIIINRVDIKVGNNIFKNVFAAKSTKPEKFNAWALNSRPDTLISKGSYLTKRDSVRDKFDNFNYCYVKGKKDGKKVCISTKQGYTSNKDISAFKYNMVYERYKKKYYKGTKSHWAVWPFTAKASFLGTRYDGTVMLDFKNKNDYFVLLCDNNHKKAYNKKTLNLKVSIVTNKSGAAKPYLILKVVTADHSTTSGSGTQMGIAYFRVTWANGTCSLNTTKLISTTAASNSLATATIGLYSNSTCTTLVSSQNINVNLADGSSGVAQFNNLKTNTTYYVKETAFVDSGGNDLLAGKYITTIASGSTGGTDQCRPITPKDNNNDKICDTGVTVTNTENVFCYSIKKVDAENNNTVVNNTTWTLTGAAGDVHTATATNGIATFTNLKYQSYTLKETTANPADLDGNGTLDYWNDYVNGVQVPATSLVAGNACSPDPQKGGIKPDKKVYYCIKIKKIDSSTGAALTGAEFTATRGSHTIDKTSNNYHTANGITSFFIGDSSQAGDYTVTETKAPNGYSLNNTTRVVSAIPMAEYTNESEARSKCFSDDGRAYDGSKISDKTYSTNDIYLFEDTKYLLNWYKTTENGSTLINGAKFKVADSTGKYITVSAPIVQKDESNIEKACYQYTGANTTGTVMTSGAAGNTDIPMTGQVCIGGLPSGTYTIIETGAPEYHTFGVNSTKTITASVTFNIMTNYNKLVNQPTEFKFNKKVTNTDGSQEGDTKYTVTINGVTKTLSLSEMTTEQLMKITFMIYNSEGNALQFKEISPGHYEFAANSVDQAGTSENTEALHLDANREIYVKHLPKGDYTIKEADTSSCQLNNGRYGTQANPDSRPASAASCANGAGAGGECIGYYSPDYSSNTYQFEIDDCSSQAASQNNEACGSQGGIETQSLTNIPTEIIFTKKDLYDYGDQADIIDNDREQNSTESSVEFENAKERSDFDRIDFKVKDKNGNYLNFVYIGNSSNTCTSDSDYSVYKYIPGLQLPSGVDPNVFNYHTASGGLTITQTLHACGGHIKLVNLCRGETYTFEEIRVPDDSVYVLEKVGELNPTVCFEIPCSTDEEEQRTSTTAVINDKPTRVLFEKKDGKYNYLIPDETTTFEVYRCPKVDGVNTLCSPSAYSTVEERELAGMKLIKFEPRSVIVGDEEDPGMEVYRMMSDSDAETKSLCENNQTSNCYVTSVHPVSGRLVIRYLQSGYNYVLLETVAPKNYILPKGKASETPFVVVNTTVDVEQVDVPNSPSAIIIRKYADLDGDNEADSDKLIGGAKFKIYKVTNYNANQKPKDQEKELLKLKTIKDGVYENRPVLDTEIVTTCSGESCSYTASSLGYDESVWEDIDDLIENSGTNVTSVLKEGTAIIQYLEYDNYYVVEEVEAPTGYSLPENDDDRFTLVHVRKNETEIVDTADALVNKPAYFTFYKFDEFNSPLDGATFYLQKLDQDKKYNTLTVSTEELITGETIYKADPKSELKEITTVGGKATVYYLEPGQYRILEVAAAEGYELPKKTINVATFFVDEDGLVYGNNIITNKKPQETITYLGNAKAELIISIQTGKTVIKYGLIITALVGAIVGLIIFLKKRK